MTVLCQSGAMDAAVYGSWSDSQACPAQADVDRDGWRLCQDCANALDAIQALAQGGLAGRMRQALGEETA